MNQNQNENQRREHFSAPWLIEQQKQLLKQKGHAWLLQGASGLGQFALAQTLACVWLCENPINQEIACGKCQSCHAIDVHTHADLLVLLPETMSLDLGFPLDERSQKEIDDKKRKPSREIRVEALREVVEFAQRTSARGRGKVVLIYPAESMNSISANTLLKTLEEPIGDVRFVLATDAAHELLPTIRSRCLVHNMAFPAFEIAKAWLQASHQMDSQSAQILLAAAGGRPDDALQLAKAGLTPAIWTKWPKALAKGDLSGLGVIGTWSAAQILLCLQKLCHDLHVLRALQACHVEINSQIVSGLRYFSVADLPKPPSLLALNQWALQLQQAQRHADHPYNAGLMLDALINQAQMVLSRTAK